MYSTEYRFRAYPCIWTDDKGTRHEIWLIALYKGEILLRLTTFHEYVRNKNRIKQKGSQQTDDVRRICNFLTYVLFERFEEYGISNIAEIPFEAVKDYLQQYSITASKHGKYPGRQSVGKEQMVVSRFMANIGAFRADRKQHYYVRASNEKLMPNGEPVPMIGRRSSSPMEYEIQVEYVQNKKNRIVRDMPQSAIKIILKWVAIKAPELYFAVVLQMCAGIREGEVVNIRRVTSCYPGGIRYSKENGVYTSFEIDLTTEYQLRSDGKKVGGIKKHRTQSVYQPFLGIVQKAYEHHLAITTPQELELEQPMFSNSYERKSNHKKMAIMKQSYCNRIEEIVKNDVIPEMLKSNDVEMKMFAMSVNEYGWGLHAFRHWFTVQLVLNGEDVNSVAAIRGDSSIKTAFWYIQNKGELMKRYTAINNQISNELLATIAGMETPYV